MAPLRPIYGPLQRALALYAIVAAWLPHRTYRSSKVLWRGPGKLRDMLLGFRLAKAATHNVQSSDE